MSITHFRRIEQKYLLNEEEYLNVLEELKPYLVEAIWYDKVEGSYSVLEHIMRRMK